MQMRKWLIAVALSLASTRVMAQGGTIGGGGTSFPLRAADGTTTLPSYSFTSGTGTGLSFSTAGGGRLQFSLAGTAYLILDALPSLRPNTDNSTDLGSSSVHFREIFAYKLTGGTGNMTILAGTGNARSLTLQSSNSSGSATTFASGAGDTIKITHGIAASLTAASGTPHAMCLDPTTHEMEDNAALTCTVSARRFKRNISSLSITEAKRIIANLKPSTFTMRSGDRKSIGLIAEEVDSVDTRLTFRDDKGQLNSVDYQAIVPILVAVVQDQQRQLDALAGVQPDSTIGPLKKHVNVNNALALLGLAGAVGGVGGVVAARRRPSLRIDFRA